MRAIEANPSLGKHVRELHWTVLDIDDCCAYNWEDEEIRREVREKAKHRPRADLREEREESACSGPAIAFDYNLGEFSLRALIMHPLTCKRASVSNIRTAIQYVECRYRLAQVSLDTIYLLR